MSDFRGTVGFTCSTFDLFHAGHIDMLTQARNVCDYLIVGLQVDPSLDRPNKNKPVQSIIERQIQLKACSLIDEIFVYQSEEDLEDLLNILQIDVRIIGDEYRDAAFTGKDICEQRGIKVWFNRRDHRFSSTELRKRVCDREHQDNEHDADLFGYGTMSGSLFEADNSITLTLSGDKK